MQFKIYFLKYFLKLSSFLNFQIFIISEVSLAISIELNCAITSWTVSFDGNNIMNSFLRSEVTNWTWSPKYLQINNFASLLLVTLSYSSLIECRISNNGKPKPQPVISCMKSSTVSVTFVSKILFLLCLSLSQDNQISSRKAQLLIIYASFKCLRLSIQVQNSQINFVLSPGHSFQKFLCFCGFTSSVLFSNAFMFCFKHIILAYLWICWLLEAFFLGEFEDLQIKRIFFLMLIWI